MTMKDELSALELQSHDGTLRGQNLGAGELEVAGAADRVIKCRRHGMHHDAAFGALTGDELDDLGEAVDALRAELGKGGEGGPHRECPECGGAMTYEAGEPGQTSGPPDAWEPEQSPAWFCAHCGHEEAADA